MYNNVFYKNILKDKEKLEILKRGIKQGKIKPFDMGTLSHLRRLYFSCYSALIYLYGEETNFETIGNKIELLTLAFEKENYTIVHADTDSTKEIFFYQYKHKHLDNNSYLEVTRGQKTYVYDTFSMLMFEKEIYEQLEHPKIIRTIPKAKLIKHLEKFPEDRALNKTPHDLWLLVKIIPYLEKTLETNPYKELVKKELQRYKNEINYDKIISDFHRDEVAITGQNKKK